MTIARLQPLKALFYLIRTGAPAAVCWQFVLGRICRQFPSDNETVQAQALAKREFDPIAKRGEFTTDWFSHHIHNWVAAFRKTSRAQRQLDILEIGSWEGMSTVFLLSFFKQSIVTAIDTWEGSDEIALGIKSDKLERRFDKNIEPFPGRIRKLKGRSAEILPTLQSNGESYDLIYVDGSHYADDVLVDSLNAWQLLRQGGVMIFDDYLWDCYTDSRENPATAINLFIKLKAKKIRIVHVDTQIIITKLSSATALRAIRADRQSPIATPPDRVGAAISEQNQTTAPS